MTLQEVKNRFGIIGSSVLLDRALQKAMQVAPTDISVLVTGESGVGKEAIPKVIHHLSHRKHAPYIAVNCGAIPEGTIDSELFGHEKGSFTGATGARKGYFEEADGGTVFLDEVGELPLPTQVRLLRVLETGEFIRVGSSKAQKVNVRVVGATNVNMLDAIKRGKFREDLFYRLNTVEIHIPPLRERLEDIHLLFRKFAADFSNKYHFPTLRLTEEAVQVLESYRWPGNIRQLRNLAEQLSVLETNRTVEANTLRNYIPAIGQSQVPMRISDGGVSESTFQNEREILYKVLFDMKREINDLRGLVGQMMGGQKHADVDFDESQGAVAEILKPTEMPSSMYAPAFSAPQKSRESVDEYQDTEEVEENLSLQEHEIEMIKRALKKNNGKRKNAAEELGISERTLYRKIKQFDL